MSHYYYLTQLVQGIEGQNSESGKPFWNHDTISMWGGENAKLHDEHKRLFSRYKLIYTFSEFDFCNISAEF